MNGVVRMTHVTLRKFKRSSTHMRQDHFVRHMQMFISKWNLNKQRVMRGAGLAHSAPAAEEAADEGGDNAPDLGED